MGKYASFKLAGEQDLYEVFSIRKKRHLLIVALFSIPLTTVLIAFSIIFLRNG